MAPIVGYWNLDRTHLFTTTCKVMEYTVFMQFLSVKVYATCIASLVKLRLMSSIQLKREKKKVIIKKQNGKQNVKEKKKVKLSSEGAKQ